MFYVRFMYVFPNSVSQFRIFYNELFFIRKSVQIRNFKNHKNYTELFTEFLDIKIPYHNSVYFIMNDSL
jgi:hypothetical protein